MVELTPDETIIDKEKTFFVETTPIDTTLFKSRMQNVEDLGLCLVYKWYALAKGKLLIRGTKNQIDLILKNLWGVEEKREVDNFERTYTILKPDNANDEKIISELSNAGIDYQNDHPLVWKISVKNEWELKRFQEVVQKIQPMVHAKWINEV